VQREETSQNRKTEEEKYKEAAKKAGEAFSRKPRREKEIKKNAEELGDAFISTLPGKVITGTAICRDSPPPLAVTHKELPIGIPEIPAR